MKNLSHYLFYALLITTIYVHAADNQVTLLNQQLFDDIKADAPLENITDLFNRGAQVNARDNAGQTPLHAAITQNNALLVEELISRDADINVFSSLGYIPLHTATFRGHLEIVKKLLRHNSANIDTPSKLINQTALHMASGWEKKAIVIELLDYGANVNAKDKHGQTPLHEATHNDLFEIVKTLLERGANPAEKNNAGVTPLNIAEDNGFYEIAEYIRDYDNIPDTKGVMMDDLG